MFRDFCSENVDSLPPQSIRCGGPSLQALKLQYNFVIDDCSVDARFKALIAFDITVSRSCSRLNLGFYYFFAYMNERGNLSEKRSSSKQPLNIC